MQPAHDLALLLARFQFAFTVGVHIIFPAFSIGLAAYLAVLEGLWLKTGRPVFLDLYRYWIKVFSIVFGMGVVSGLVMSYEFGTNWSVFSQKAGPITGVLLSYEVMTAFFLEAGFLGVMLFGMNKVGRGLHFAATCCVSIGTLISMTWILSSNSWMQTPRGYSIDPTTGRFMPADWLAIIFNPSFPFRLVHMGLAAFLSVAFIVGATGAWHMLKARREGRIASEPVRVMFSMAMWMAAIVAPIQIMAGDAHGLNTLKYQPAKIAAMEGDWISEGRAPELLFGIPNMKEERTDYAVKVPLLGSLILTHSLEGKVPGLKDFPRDQRPPSPVIFFSFRIMVALGMLMALVGFWSLWLRRNSTLFTNTLFHRVALCMAPAGFLALLCGWITTEVGRQPWTVYGLLRTSDSVSPIALSSMAVTMTAFVVVYVLVFGSGMGILVRLLGRAPQEGEHDTPPSHASDILAARMHPDVIDPSAGKGA
ncbi:cytochrome ubiquinol oxidase subunit I [Acetobacter tropicalis]|uniref:Putative Cytochrome bd2, subunit I n=1 Tax=Acetobacter tropicalis TaxID=104102 RepID=A0A094YQ91_9PROT|nr:cytochrome ubiquinol oxidase subunit I [Acetobacter tropicalis]KAA8385636.1 cytochrome ubiquinol oxidase subunit I [Acetobacter tropicalis]KAA8386715.1 cytochrome ubiquinol oxidase subunit I [Acetobacter tropicalis]KGB22754.1 putative Cytochrome bd2, subunit I [Acetobacter tropicalis]MBC9008225.1 cytochrome ubiquinol oxidase subunit I [Acetobacter tropicalis]MDO8170780.1 cytochrome ubiquinol oxidase subunit I [Acetobacter tropicalis]